MIEKKRLSRDWTISIFDGDGVNLARVPNPQKHPSASAHLAIKLICRDVSAAPEATLPTVSLEGVPLITGFTRSRMTGWTVAAGIAEGSLIAPLWRWQAITGVIGGNPAPRSSSVSHLQAGDRDRARRGAARSLDREAQPPRGSRTRSRFWSRSRHADLPQREPRRARGRSRTARRACRGDTTCSAWRNGRAPICRT